MYVELDICTAVWFDVRAMSHPSGPLVLGIAGMKGGIGKSTTAEHVAAHLALGGRKTLVADGDRLRTVSSLARKGRMPFEVAGVASLARAGQYDVVIIDSRGGPEDQELIELAQTCDLLLLPTTPDLNGLDGLIQTVEVLRKAGIPAPRYAALLVMVRPGTMKEITARKALQEDGVATLRASVRQSEAFRDAANAGVLVRDVRGDVAAKGWADYGAVASEVLTRSRVSA